MKVLLLGAQGQLGHAFQELAKTESFPIGWNLIAWSHREADLTKLIELKSRLETLQPDLIINAAAYTQVDLAETETELCDEINFRGPEALSAYAKANQIPLVHFSTDYVYGDDGTQVHVETDALTPVNQYGRSKAKGDQAIIASGSDYLIFRTSWIYAKAGKNFVRTLLTLSQSKKELRVVQDQFGSPTYAPDLAMYVLDALMRSLEFKSTGETFPSGVYHVCNSGFTNWAEFAAAILPDASIIPIPSRDYLTAARRPLNSRLSLEKFKATFKIEPRDWKIALKECLVGLHDSI